MFTAALADAGCEAFCIYGPPGVGKTRLGDECLVMAEAAGRRVLRASADRSTAAVPFGAVAHLMPGRALAAFGDGDVINPVGFAKLFDTARKVLAPVGEEAGVPVLLLDDAHRLDSTSLTMIDRLMAHGALFCIATMTAGQAMPETLTRWWRDERAARVDIGELDQLGVDTLLHVALEGPLDAAASAELWAASRGNVLALRELVLGARARGLLVHATARGAWTGRSAPRPDSARSSRHGSAGSMPPLALCSSCWRCASQSASASSRRCPGSRSWRSWSATG